MNYGKRLNSVSTKTGQVQIERHNIDLVIHGDDFSTELEKLCYKTPIEMGIYRTVGYTLGISTTELITRIKAAEPD